MKINKINTIIANHKSFVIASRRRSNPLLALLLALSLVSCSNSIQPESQSTTESTSNEQDIAYITLAEPTFGNNSRTIAPNSDNNDYLTSSLHNLVFTGQKYDAEGNLGTEQTLAEAVNYSTADGIEGISGKKIPLEAGTWKLKLTATMSGAPMEGTIDNKVISNGSNTSISFNLSAPSDFEWGGCYLHLKFDNTNNKVSKIILTLKKDSIDGELVDTKEFTSTDFVTVSSATKQINYMRQLADETQRLVAGYYYVIFDFYKVYDEETEFRTGSELLNSIGQKMYIDRGHWTTWTSSIYNINEIYSINYEYYVNDEEDTTYAPTSGIVLPAAYSSRSEELEIPEVEKDGYIFLGWYTDNTFATRLPDNGSDYQIIAAGSAGSKTLCARFIKPELYVSSSGTSDGNGFTEATAMDSLGDTIEKMNSLCETMTSLDILPDSFTINIIGDVTGGVELNTTYNLPEKVILVGKDDGTSKLKLSGSETNPVLTINNGGLEVEISNLTITGANRGDSSSGGGIYLINGTCTLADGAKITGNSATLGSGVYVSSGATFQMGGGAQVTEDNDVYLSNGIKLIITNQFDGDITHAATITPETYSEETQVLDVTEDGNATLENAYNVFTVTPEEGVGGTTNWTIGTDGKLVKQTGGNGGGGNGGNGGSSNLDDFSLVSGAIISTNLANSGFSSCSTEPITIRDLYVCTHEVTQAEYTTYCTYGGTATNDDDDVDTYPVYNVSWYDAIVYCNLRSLDETLMPVYSINNKTNPAQWPGIGGSGGKLCGPDDTNDDWEWNSGSPAYNGNPRTPGYDSIVVNNDANGYRLPTAIEWEYFARGGNGLSTDVASLPNSGCDDDNLKLYAHVASWDENRVDTDNVYPIMEKNANTLGLYDLCGNVKELCFDVQADGDYRTTFDGYYIQNGQGSIESYTRDSSIGFRVVRNVHNSVDFGTGVKWATTNVGAETIADYGAYYAWGETDTRYNEVYRSDKVISWKSGYTNGYSWTGYEDGTDGADFTKYTNVEGNNVLSSTDDVATQKRGAKWRMPTPEECQTLLDACYMEFTDNYNGSKIPGVILYKAKDPDDAGKNTIKYPSEPAVATYSYSDTHIFFPAAGYFTSATDSDCGLNSFKSDVLIWTNAIWENYGNGDSARMVPLKSDAGYTDSIEDEQRYYGLNVRPVYIGD